MEEFKHHYLRLCKEYHIDTQDCVLKQLNSASGGSPTKHGRTSLNLSTNSLTPKTCAVLGKLLATDRMFSEIRLNDCMITEDGIKVIAHGLSSNVACQKLYLKGNNIRASGAEALGKMLRDNTTLTHLCLEWNSLGMLENSFSIFCDGLAANTSLFSLDLRNNQISHDGATELSQALKRNSTLLHLDLRWNNVGIIGGRSLLCMLETNKTLSKLDLAGNNVPVDISKAIDTAILANSDHQALANEYQSRQNMLGRELTSLKKEKQSQMVNLMDTLDKQEESLRRTQRSSGHKIGQLQAALEERKTAFNSLAAKLSMVESELAVSEVQNNDYQTIVLKVKQEQEDSKERHMTELRREREGHQLTETKLLKEVTEFMEKNSTLENKLDEVERKCKVQQEQIYDLKEQLTHNQADLKLKASHFEEKVHHEKQKYKDALREMEELQQREISRCQQDCGESEKTLKDRIQKLENNRLELEEEISRMKNVHVADRLQNEEHLMITKQKIRQEEEQRCKQYEEKIRLLQQSKDETQSHANMLSGTVQDLQSKNSGLVLENEALKRKIEGFQNELAGKNSEMMTEVGKVRLEMAQRMNKLEAENQTQSELRDKMHNLDQQLTEQTVRNRDAIHAKEREITELQERLKSKETEIQRMREDEAQRASVLQQAILNYVKH
ncbi:leucine-rich repeat-containing protein 45-like [Lineus longissimus]|uniref:leucine-rich repeat-containing protein 45-like n=1 Tax=Lineus longissimus TaxID=88925 RepID=UPI002B4CB099